MQQVFYFSERQRAHQNTSIYIDGIEFSEQMSLFDDEDVPEHNNWEDSVVVAVKKCLPLDVRYYTYYGMYLANTKNLNIEYEK